MENWGAQSSHATCPRVPHSRGAGAGIRASCCRRCRPRLGGPAAPPLSALPRLTLCGPAASHRGTGSGMPPAPGWTRVSASGRNDDPSLSPLGLSTVGPSSSRRPKEAGLRSGFGSTWLLGVSLGRGRPPSCGNPSWGHLPWREGSGWRKRCPQRILAEHGLKTPASGAWTWEGGHKGGCGCWAKWGPWVWGAAGLFSTAADPFTFARVMTFLT